MSADDVLREMVREMVREEIARQGRTLTPPDAASSDLISLEEAAALSKRRSTKTIRNWIAAKKIASFGEGNRILVSRAELLSLLSRPRTQTEKPAATVEAKVDAFLKEHV